MYGGFAENRQRPSVFTTAQWRVNRLEQYDLHVHTNWSDGSMPVEEAVEFAARRGLAGLAVSDHDSMEMVGRARRRAASLGLTVIPAAELSCIDPDTRRKVHLLVYAPSVPRCWSRISGCLPGGAGVSAKKSSDWSAVFTLSRRSGFMNLRGKAALFTGCIFCAR